MADEIQPPQQPSAGPQPTQTHPEDLALDELLRSFKEKLQRHEIRRGEALRRAMDIIEGSYLLRHIHRHAGRIHQNISSLIEQEWKVDFSDHLYRWLIQGHHFGLLEQVENQQQRYHLAIMERLDVITEKIHRAQNNYRRICHHSPRLLNELSRGRLEGTYGGHHIIELVEASRSRCDVLFPELVDKYLEQIWRMAGVKDRADERLEKAAQRREEVERILAQQAG
ncbi:hypothetical protein KJ359_006442 [Pestalotiopsis sp. 9143b]|nr:hypothetical protein KJ359_006442 [Pestalotiopsis sp. 9143b]